VTSTHRVAIFLNWPGFDINVSPAVYTLLKLLLDDGVEIDLFTPSQLIKENTVLASINNVYENSKPRTITWKGLRHLSGEDFFGEPYKDSNRLRKEERDYFYRDVLKTFKLLFYIVQNRKRPLKLVCSLDMYNAIMKRVSQKTYDYTIGIEEAGLVIAHQVLPDVPLLYYSLELYYEDYPKHAFRKSLYGRFLKKFQRQAFAYVDAVIIQDEDRAFKLFEDMHQIYIPTKVLYFPVSYLGAAMWQRDSLLRDRFPSIGNRTILLQAGSIVLARYAAELMSAAHSCPPDMAVVFHGKFDKASKEMAENTPCYVSMPVPFDMLERIPASADIGLVFYPDWNDNDRFTAHASGQLALFLKCGVPVIVRRATSLYRLIKTYDCGVAVDSASEIFDAARIILANYEAYCQRALQCFQNEHDLGNYYLAIQSWMSRRCQNT